MAVEQRPVERLVAGARPVATTEARPVVPVKAWATFGGICVAAVAFVWIKWISGPYLRTVHTGPTPVPGYMKTAIIIAQPAMVLGSLGFLWWFLIRPWRQERRLSIDGILCIAFFLVWFQDSLTDWFSPWFTWNSYFVNVGSWNNDVPGWLSYGAPGHQMIEPVPFGPALYIVTWLSMTLIGCHLQTLAKARWPQLGFYRLFALNFVAMVIADIIIEGCICEPLGFWSYPGGPTPALFPSTYHALPINEMICIGLMMSAYGSFRFWRDDRGYTLAERGVERIAGRRRQGWLRVLAVVGAVQLIFLLTTTVPDLFFTSHTRAWPADTRTRSYMTDGLCGAGTDRACPGPGVPFTRGNSAFVTRSGQLGLPATSNRR